MTICKRHSQFSLFLHFFTFITYVNEDAQCERRKLHQAQQVLPADQGTVEGEVCLNRHLLHTTRKLCMIFISSVGFL